MFTVTGITGRAHTSFILVTVVGSLVSNGVSVKKKNFLYQFQPKKIKIKIMSVRSFSSVHVSQKIKINCVFSTFTYTVNLFKLNKK